MTYHVYMVNGPEGRRAIALPEEPEELLQGDVDMVSATPDKCELARYTIYRLPFSTEGMRIALYDGQLRGAAARARLDEMRG